VPTMSLVQNRPLQDMLKTNAELVLATSKSAPIGSFAARTSRTADTVADVEASANAIHSRTRRLEISLEEVFEQNEKLRAEAQFAKDERDAAERVRDDTLANYRTLQNLYDVEKEQNATLRKINRTVEEKNQGLKRDNTAFHSENVDVRVNYDELQRERLEREMQLELMTTERDGYKKAFDELQDKFNSLQSQVAFASSEYSLRHGPPDATAVQQTAKDQAEASADYSAYLRDVALGHPLSRIAMPKGVDALPLPIRSLGRMAHPASSVFNKAEAATGWGNAALEYARSPYSEGPPKLHQDMYGSYARADLSYA